MPTTEPPSASRAPTPRLAALGGGALVLAIVGTYAARGDWATAAGVVTGAGLVTALLLVARRRAARGTTEAGTADRLFGGGADERDRLVYLWTMTGVGIAALFVAALGPVVASLGVAADALLTTMPYVLIGVGVVAFLVADRRI